MMNKTFVMYKNMNDLYTKTGGLLSSLWNS